MESAIFAFAETTANMGVWLLKKNIGFAIQYNHNKIRPSVHKAHQELTSTNGSKLVWTAQYCTGCT